MSHGIIDSECRNRRGISPGSTWIALLAFAGLLLLLYPSTASWWSQYQQSRLIIGAGETLSGESSSELGEQIVRARGYNEALAGGAVVAPGSTVPTAHEKTDGRFDYDSLLNATEEGIMGRLKIDSIALDLPIYHGTDDETLEKGVGHLEGTALPVGGDSSRSVLTAHRGLPSSELFTRLNSVAVDDTFTIEVFGEVLSYRVVDTQVVQPEETEALDPQQGRDLVTLVTCTPLGINSHRILVTGERITPTPVADVEKAGLAPEVPGFPWWSIGLAGGIAAVCALVWWMRPKREILMGSSTPSQSPPGVRGDPPLLVTAPGGGASFPERET